MAFPDPLRIQYVVLINDDNLEDASPFQGFGPSWPSLTWALALLTQMPADVIEPTHSSERLIAQRMGGMRQLLWMPLNISALEKSNSSDFGSFIVLFSGHLEVKKRADLWINQQKTAVLHLCGDYNSDNTTINEIIHKNLRDYCQKVFDQIGHSFSESRRKAVEVALKTWKAFPSKKCNINNFFHNITLPNHMTLVRNGYELEDGVPFIGKNESEYRNAILETVNAIYSIREESGVKNFHRMTTIQPEIYLIEPAFFRYAYQRIGTPKVTVDNIAIKTLRMMQSQKGFYNEIKSDFALELIDSDAAKQIISIRQEDVSIFSHIIGLKASQTCSSVMRLSPGVNHVFPALSNYARNVRSPDYSARRKTPRLFSTIQSQLCDAIGKDCIDFINKSSGPIKIISDSPIEWLPSRNLPLMLRRNCSRINATPGNLLASQLAMSEPMTINPEELRRILVISSFSDKDRLRNLLIGSIETLSEGWRGKVQVKCVTVKSKEAFIKEINETDAFILVFDGHGHGNELSGVGSLRIGDEDVDVWSLRNKIRIPPIVILSACDTQGVDSASHATVGNGFLAIGAKTVLATLLPVDGRISAEFIARLVFRLADYIPAALKELRRTLNWTEVISGMQRMLVASEILTHTIGLPSKDDPARRRIQTAVNVKINLEYDEWFEELISDIAILLDDDEISVMKHAAKIIARSEAIRYIQLGNPENILIDDGTIFNSINKRK